LDRKARLAATASINKGKACDAEAPWSTAGRAAARRRRALPARSALRGADHAAAGTFTVLPDGGRMDLTLRLSENAQDGMPRTDYNVAHCLGGTGS